MDDTAECVSSIEDKCKTDNYKIVIVDNASPNDSKKELEKLYKNDASVDLILLDENIGFAKGNNKGIEFAKEQYSPKFIVAMNNDVNLLQDNTFELIKSEYQKSHFAVLGPMIYTADGRCNDNPGSDVPMTRQKLDSVIIDAKRYYLICKWNLRSVYGLLEKIKDKIKRKTKVESGCNDYLSIK